MSRLWILATVGTALLVSCTASAVPSTIVTTTEAPRVSSVPSEPTTSEGVATTSSTTSLPPPEATVEVDGAPPELEAAVAAFYTWVLDTERADPALPPGLVEALRQVDAGTRSIEVSGVASQGDVLGSRVALVTAGEDVVLAVDDGAGWQVVGARLSRFDQPAWYGGSPRLLMIIGSDARPGQNPLLFRADSLHIMGIAPARVRASIVGIPRDTVVTKPDGTQDKLTHAMANQGPAVLTKTVENLTGLELDGYVVTGFRGFIDVVNALGGFTFDVPFGISDPQAEANFRRGVQRFGGADALAWARTRKIKGGDFARQRNGGELLLAMLTEAREQGVEPGDVPGLLATFSRFVATDLSATELFTMAVAVIELDPAEVDNVVVPGTIGRAAGRSVVILDDEAFTIFADLGDGALDSEYPPFP
jgi:LCP family protein required for cell wall assembly